ncbi:hypothetical protein L484_027029 [Morus notabilis]|uniref:Uncharacterized protein n=1 Tax=Morus notabilis TaxID=981085 RepID=W9R1H5_9ROSA|nr:hypothetical protein L484_027029 [Morus notabilis]
MAGVARTLRSGSVFLLLFLLLSFFSYGTETQASNTMKLAGSWRGIEAGTLDQFTLRAVKHSGPSPSGPGHRSSVNSRLLVRIKASVREGHN